MLLPSFVRPSGDFFDDFFEDFFPSTKETPFNLASPMKEMKTDVKDCSDHYEVSMNVPGFDKEDLKVSVEKGYLTITAEKSNEINETDNDGHYIRRERSYGSCSRKFYVGDNINEDEIKAQYKRGVLRLTVPKKTVEVVDDKKYIDIE